MIQEQHAEWADGRRYLGLEALDNSRLAHNTTDTDDKEDTNHAGAISA